MTYEDGNENIEIRIIFRNINGFANKSEDYVKIEGVAFYTFVNVK